MPDIATIYHQDILQGTLEGLFRLLCRIGLRAASRERT
jgi:hypothetical protein